MKRILVSKSIEKIGEIIRVSGWISNIRDHGNLIFLELRDWSGILQIVINSENNEVFQKAKELGLEYVVTIEGEIVKRSEGLENKNIGTGRIEMKANTLEILNTSKVLPFPLSDDGREIDENLRLKYRFLDIRRKRLQELIKMRSEFLRYTTDWFTDHEFTQVQTPLLTVSSPEGARDFLVPSRLYPGKFYALPQAPQQYKQLLMVGGLHRYFQIAPCFRDEDPRADRHYGTFYQIDCEFSFATQEEIWETLEPYFKDLIETKTNKTILQYPFLRISYTEALDKYGSDKPDVRFGLKLTNLEVPMKNGSMEVLKSLESVKGLVLNNTLTRKEQDELIEKVKQQGAKGLLVIPMIDGVFQGSLAKFFDEMLQKEVVGRLKENEYEISGEQTLLCIAGPKKETDKQMGWLRLYLRDTYKLVDSNVVGFAWIIDFDMFEWSENENRWDFMHNPFSMPLGGLEALKTLKPDQIKAQQYDLACNGYEILSGSIRNHHPQTFIEAFKICGYTEEETRNKFGHIISAFEYGAPPHGGFAVGLDRFLMTLFDQEHIRDMYAFPMSANGMEAMMNAPREVSQKDLDALKLQVTERGEHVVEQIKGILEQNNVQFQLVEHAEVRTSEEAAKIRGTKLSEGAKAMVIKSKVYDSKYAMIVLPADKQLDLASVSKILGEEYEIAPKDEVEQVTGVKMGGVPPFGRLFRLETYFDVEIGSEERIAFNCGRRDRSIIMKSSDLIKLAQPNDQFKGSKFSAN
jgi:aspartyl-tRNA synthetase